MKTFKKVMFWIVCACALAAIGYEGLVRYALWRVPYYVNYAGAKDRRKFALDWLLSRKPPLRGGLYEDEYYKFRLLSGYWFMKLPNGYVARRSGMPILTMREYSSWSQYIGFNKYINIRTGLVEIPRVTSNPYSGKLEFAVLPSNMYGGVKTIGQVVSHLPTGEDMLVFDAGDLWFHRHWLIQKRSGHIVDIDMNYSSWGGGNKVLESVSELLITSLVLKKDLPVETLNDVDVKSFDAMHMRESPQAKDALWKQLPE